MTGSDSGCRHVDKMTFHQSIYRKKSQIAIGKIIRAVAAGCLFALLVGCGPQAPEHTLVTADGDAVRFPLKEVDDGNVHFYTYKYKDKNINFLVRTDGKGKLHAHFDACYACFKYKLGYCVEGPDILCIACGLKYSLAEEAWDFIGPCAPISMKSKVQENFMVIKVSTLEKGERLF